MVQGMAQGKDEANRENACRMKADDRLPSVSLPSPYRLPSVTLPFVYILPLIASESVQIETDMSSI